MQSGFLIVIVNAALAYALVRRTVRAVAGAATVSCRLCLCSCSSWIDPESSGQAVNRRLTIIGSAERAMEPREISAADAGY